MITLQDALCTRASQYWFRTTRF